MKRSVMYGRRNKELYTSIKTVAGLHRSRKERSDVGLVVKVNIFVFCCLILKVAAHELLDHAS